jgi:hypothetical protein
VAAGEGEPDVARVHFEAAFAAASGSGQAASLAFAVEGLAALRASDQPEHAAILLGAASTLWGAASVGERSHRDDIGAAADRARLVLGDDAFAAAFSTGAAMTPAEAVAIASRAGQ